jgi:hypothetical protein
VPGVSQTQGLVAELFSHRRWLLLGVVVAVAAAASRFVAIGILPPSFKVRHLTHATANTELLVGKQYTYSAGYRDPYVNAVVPRAQALADMTASPEVRGYIARAAGLPSSQIAVDPPIWTDVERIQQWPTGERRSTQIVVEGAPYRIQLDAEGYAPVLDVSTQAPTVAEAASLAAGVGKGLTAYLTHLEDSTGTPKADRYGISELGPVSASASGKSVPANVAGYTFAVVLFLWCGGMLFVAGIADNVRALRRRAKVSGGSDRSSRTRAPWPGTKDVQNPMG